MADVNTDAVAYAKNIHEKNYPASLTKIMTCLLALENGKMSFVDTDLKKTVVKLTHNLTKKSPNKDASFVTLIYGEDVAEDQAEEIREAVAERLGDSAEVVLIAGKQPVYYFIISVE